MHLIAWLEGDEGGRAERLGDPDGKVEGPVDDRDDGWREGALPRHGLLEGDEEGCALRHLAISRRPTIAPGSSTTGTCRK